MEVVPGTTIQKDVLVQVDALLWFGTVTKLVALELTPKQYAEVVVSIPFNIALRYIKIQAEHAYTLHIYHYNNSFQVKYNTMKVLDTAEVRRKFSLIVTAEIDVIPCLLVLDTFCQQMAQTCVGLIKLLEPVGMAELVINATGKEVLI